MIWVKMMINNIRLVTKSLKDPAIEQVQLYDAIKSGDAYA